jgi:pimeloyl-ACP methyl ester carboxylesterase
MARLLAFAILLSAFLSFIAGSGAAPEAAKPKTAVILVHGAFGNAAVWDQVKSCLCNNGYDVEAVDLPSVGKGAEKVDRTPDIKVVQKAIGKRVHNGRGQNVILVGNSYGATVIGDAVKDFESLSSVNAHAPAQGRVLGLIMVSNFLVIMCNCVTYLQTHGGALHFLPQSRHLLNLSSSRASYHISPKSRKVIPTSV